MENGIISVCVVGSGLAAADHVRAYRRNPHVMLAAVASRREEGLRPFCRRLKIKKYYTDYAQMFALEKPDAVSVCTPTDTHERISIDAMEAGCHVLCEKPIANTLAEADRMIETSRQINKLLLVSFPLRFMKEYLQVKETLKTGVLGRVKVIWYRRGKGLPGQKWYLDSGRSGGAATELAIHGIDLIRWLSDSPVISVTAEAIGSIYNMGKEDNIWIVARFENGGMGIVGSSYSYPFFDTDFGICGDKMALRLFRGKMLIEDLKKKHTLMSTFMRYCAESFILPHRILSERPFDREIDHFVSCIRDKRESPLNGINARANLDIALRALDSAKNGNRVYLNV